MHILKEYLNKLKCIDLRLFRAKVFSKDFHFSLSVAAAIQLFPGNATNSSANLATEQPLVLVPRGPGHFTILTVHLDHGKTIITNYFLNKGAPKPRRGRMQVPQPPSPTQTDQWQWGGCSDNVRFGLQKSREFMDSRYRKRSDIKTLIKLHNHNAGRLVSKHFISWILSCKLLFTSIAGQGVGFRTLLVESVRIGFTAVPLILPWRSKNIVADEITGQNTYERMSHGDMSSAVCRMIQVLQCEVVETNICTRKIALEHIPWRK